MPSLRPLFEAVPERGRPALGLNQGTSASAASVASMRLFSQPVSL